MKNALILEEKDFVREGFGLTITRSTCRSEDLFLNVVLLFDSLQVLVNICYLTAETGIRKHLKIYIIEY